MFQIPNASPTAASASSDIYGAAVQDACEQIKSRMKPVASRLGENTSFSEVKFQSYYSGIGTMVVLLSDLT